MEHRPCVRCGHILHTGEAKVTVSFTPNELAELIDATFNMKWKFQCPVCEHVACVQDWKDAGAPQNSAGFSCVGRWAGVNPEADKGDIGPNGIAGKGPCNYAGGGLFKLNPVTVVDPDGHEMHCFAFAV